MGFQHEFKECSIARHPCRSFFPYPGFTDAQRAQPNQKGGGQSQTLHLPELVFTTNPFYLVIYAELVPEHPLSTRILRLIKIPWRAALIA